MPVRNGLTAGDGPPKPDTAAILSEAERILASPAFRSSKRSQEMIHHALAGDFDGPKERVIGQEIFGRPLDYDTGQDSIVRGKVNEVRKRLAQYFDEAGEMESVRIEIPVGSYVPEFHEIRHHPLPPPPAQRRPGLFLAAAVASCVALAALGIAAVAHYWKPSNFEVFCRPFLEPSKSVTICVAHPKVYSIYGSQLDELLMAHRSGTVERDVSKAPLERRPSAVIIPEVYNFVGVGDAHAIGHLCGLFGARNQSYQIRRGNDMSFAEMRSAPSVPLGGFSNQWSVSLLRELRFIPRDNRPGLTILDQKEGREVASVPTGSGEPPHTYVDYAIISRLIRSHTGEPLLGVVGVSHHGTMAAAELVTSEAAWERMLDRVSGWAAGKNLQVVVRVNVIMRTPERIEMTASHVW